MALFTKVQAWTQISGTGSFVAVGPATTPGNTLIVHASASTLTPFTAPNANWRLINTVPAGTSGHIEHWMLPAQFHTVALTSITFTGPAGVVIRGTLVSELSVASGFEVTSEAIGSNNGTQGQSFPLAAACGNAAQACGIASFLSIYSGSAPGGAWGTISGWPFAASLGAGSVSNPWYCAVNANVGAGMASLTQTLSSTPVTNQTAWCAALTILRARRFRPCNVSAGGADGRGSRPD